MMAERGGLCIGKAFVHLRTHARNHNERLTIVCQAVLDGTLRLPDLVPTPEH